MPLLSLINKHSCQMLPGVELVELLEVLELVELLELLEVLELVELLVLLEVLELVELLELLEVLELVVLLELLEVLELVLELLDEDDEEVAEVVEVGDGGKGLSANKQFIPSLELVVAESVTRTALTVPTFRSPGSRFVVFSWISTTPLVLRP
eukprot:Skav221514  [mRNA]  locus=scaffold1248:41783:43773:+ [translate_table: standard]